MDNTVFIILPCKRSLIGEASILESEGSSARPSRVDKGRFRTITSVQLSYQFAFYLVVAMLRIKTLGKF